MMVDHIVSFAVDIGFENALSLLTRVPVNKVSQINNEFKYEFWENEVMCPINKCGKAFHNKYYLKQHLPHKHNLGSIKYKCQYCDYKSQSAIQLEKHQIKKHFGKVTKYNCRSLIEYKEEEEKEEIIENVEEIIEDIAKNKEIKEALEKMDQQMEEMAKTREAFKKKFLDDEEK